MKSTESFKKVIEAKLKEMADLDALFAVSLKKENKNIDACISYILSAVNKSGYIGFLDDEIFGMAAHYYDEDNINVGSHIDCQIVINQVVELSEDEKKEARKKVFDLAVSQEQERLRSPAIKKPKPVLSVQPTLF